MSFFLSFFLFPNSSPSFQPPSAPIYFYIAVSSYELHVTPPRPRVARQFPHSCETRVSARWIRNGRLISYSFPTFRTPPPPVLRRFVVEKFHIQFDIWPDPRPTFTRPRKSERAKWVFRIRENARGDSSMRCVRVRQRLRRSARKGGWNERGSKSVQVCC